MSGGALALLIVLVGNAATVCAGEDLFFYNRGKKVPIIIADSIAAQRKPRPTGDTVRRVFRSSLSERLPGASPDVDVARVRDGAVLKLQLEGGAMPGETLDSLRRQQDVELEPVGTWVAVAGASDIILPNRVVARLAADASRPAAEAEIERLGLRQVAASDQEPDVILLESARFDPVALINAANELHRDESFAWAHPDFVSVLERRSACVPGAEDPLLPLQWHLANDGRAGGKAGADIQASHAWTITRGAPETVVAVIDDGFDYEHGDLRRNFLEGRDFAADPVDDDPSPDQPGENHGTAVAGLITASRCNGEGGVGVCPECRLLPIRIAVAGASAFQQAEAIRYAARFASVLVNSWGYERGQFVPKSVAEAVDNAVRHGRSGRGAVVFFAMPNGNYDACEEADIAALPGVVAIGASSNQDRRVATSAFGTCLDLLAPSHRGYLDTDPFVGTLNIITTDRVGIEGYNRKHPPGSTCPETEPEQLRSYTHCFGGTSAATPIAAGVAALLLSLNPQLTGAEVIEILRRSADKIDSNDGSYSDAGFSRTHGYGRVNAYRALVPSFRAFLRSSPGAVGEVVVARIEAAAPFALRNVEVRLERKTGATWNVVSRQTLGAQGAKRLLASWSEAIAAPGTYRIAGDSVCDGAPAGYPSSAAAAGTVAVAEFSVAP